MKKLLFLLLAAVLSLTQGVAQNVLPVTVGTGTSTTQVLPFCHNYDYSHSQMLFLSEEIVEGQIDSISFYYSYSTPKTINNAKVYLGSTDRTRMSKGNFMSADSLTVVYEGSITFSQGWVTIPFTTPFSYNGTDNLVLAFTNGHGAYSAHSGATFRQTSTADTMAVLNYADGTPVTVNNAGTVGAYNFGYKYRPNVIFHTVPPAGYCYPPENLTVSNITANGAEISWESDASSTTFAVEYKLATEEDWTLASNSISGNTYTLSGLETYTTYNVKVYTVCTENSRAVSTSFTTTPDASLMLSIPYEQDFDNIPEEGLEKWFFQNGGTNAWHLGTAANNTRDESGELTENGGAMYISNDNGVSNNYSGTSSCYYAYTFVTFEEESTYGLQFDWRCMGETSTWDYARVYLLPIDATLSPTSMPAVANAVTEVLNGSASWQTVGMEIPQSYSGNTWKLVFAWKDDQSNENPPAIAIDNLNIRTLTCKSVDSVLVSVTDDTGSINASFDIYDQNTGAEYLLEYRASGTEAWSSVTSASPVEVTDLLNSMVYEYRVTALCGTSDNSLVSDVDIFTTPCMNISVLPYEQSFDQKFYPADSVIGNNTAPYCWYNINRGYDGYYFYRSTSSSIINGAASLYYVGASYSSATRSYNWVISPAFDLTGNERLNFKLKTANTSSSYPDLVVNVYALDVSETDISAPTDTSRFTLVQTINHDWTTTDYLEYEVALGAYSAATRFAFVVNGVCRSFYLDDVKVSEMPACPDVYQVSASAMSSTSAAVSFATANGTEAGWTIAYGTVEEGETFDPETATTVAVAQTDEVPVTISGLTAGETYWFAVKQACEGGAYSVPVSCYIPVTNALPYEQNFDDASTVTEWNFVKRSTGSTSDWIVGTAVNNTTDEEGTPTEGGAMYISKDNGVSNKYDPSSSANIYAVTVVELSGSPAYNLSFDWKAGGESSCDFMRAYLVPFGIEIPTSYSSYNTELDDYAIISQSYLSGGQWESESMLLTSADYNGVYQLIFRWANDGSVATDSAGAAIDNIRLVALDCGPVTSVTATAEAPAVDAENVTINVDVDDNNTDVTYVLQYRISTATDWTEVTDLTEADFPYAITADFGMVYQIRVAAVCSDGERTTFVSATNVITPCTTLTAPWSETFETTPFTAANCWVKKTGLLPASGSIQTSALTSGYGWQYNDTRIIDGETSGRLRLNIYGQDRYEWVITPSVDLGDGSTTYQLAFDVALTTWNTGNAPAATTGDDKFAVLVSTDNGVSWSASNGIIFADGDADTQHNYSDLTNSATRVVFKLVDAEDAPLSGTVRFAFYGESTVTGGDNDCFVDNIELSEWSDCQAPYNVRVNNVTDNSADLSFAAIDATASFEYSLVEGADADVATGTPVAVTGSLTEALSSLSPATTYRIAVRTVCSGGSYSAWSVPATFKTLATPETIPYSTDFEDSDDNATWSFASSSSVNAWAIGTATFAGEDATGTSAYLSNDNGVSYAATVVSSGMRAVMFKDFDFGEDENAVYNLDLDYKVVGRTSGSSVYCGLLVYVLDPQPISTSAFPAVDEEALLYGESDWTHERIELRGYTGVKRLAFMTWGYTTASETVVPAAVDNVSLQVATCVSPQEVTVSNEITSSVDVSWTGTSASYIISYRALTDTELTDVPATSSPFTLTGLDPATQYILAVKGVCGEETSVYSDAVLFSTTCFDGAIDEFPYEEGFENGIDCWTSESSYDTPWTVASTGNNPSCSPHGGSQMIEFLSNDYSYQDEWGAIISNAMDFTQDMEVSFWIYHNSEYNNRLDSVLVYVNDAATLEQATLVGGVGRYNTTSGWTQYTFPLPTGLTGIHHIILKGVSHYGRNIYVDDLKVDYAGDAPAPCDAPTTLTTSNVTETGATVSWNGTASSYEVRLAGGTAETVSTTSKTFTNLTAGTAYTVEVRAVCESGNSSWVSTSFTTQSSQVDPCDAPTALTASNVTQTEATVSWNGTASSYEVRLAGGTAETVTTTSKTFTNLTAGTAYTVEVRAVCESSQSAWVSTSFTTQNAQGVTAPTVTTLAATSVTHEAATLNGTITAGSEAITAQGFKYKATTATDWTTVSATGTTLTVTVNNLTAETTYEYKAFATTASETVEGEVMNFTTLAASGLADIENGISAIVYPNPAKDKAMLRLSGLTTTAKVIISDLQGRIILTDDIQAGVETYELNTSNYASGVYYIRIVSGNKVNTQKLIVE